MGRIMKKNKNKRGFLITIDTVVATAILLVALFLIGVERFMPLAPDGIYLKQVSLDVLSIIKNTGRIGYAIGENITAVREVFEITPKSICLRLIISEAIDEDSIITITKTDCSGYEKELQTAYTTVIYEDEIYICKLESWYKKD